MQIPLLTFLFQFLTFLFQSLSAKMSACAWVFRLTDGGQS